MNTPDIKTWHISPDSSATLTLESGRIFFVCREDDQWFVHQNPACRTAPEHIWMIAGSDGQNSLHISNAVLAKPYEGGLTLELRGGKVEVHPRYPHADALNNRMEISVPGCDGLMIAQAASSLIALPTRCSSDCSRFSPLFALWMRTMRTKPPPPRRDSMI